MGGIAKAFKKILGVPSVKEQQAPPPPAVQAEQLSTDTTTQQDMGSNTDEKKKRKVYGKSSLQIPTQGINANGGGGGVNV